MFGLIIIAVALAVAVLIGVGIFYGQAYSWMLLNAKTPWYLLPPIGEYVLLAFFTLGTVSRKICPRRVDKGMQEFAAAKVDLLTKSRPSKKGVCFIGSSTFTYWRHLTDDFRSLKNVQVFNSAFGGSCTHDLLHNVSKLCTEYDPAIVVYFCGTNNVAQGLTAESVLEGFECFSKIYLGSCPEGHIIFLSITETPFYQKWNINNCLQEASRANALVQTFCELKENRGTHTFVGTSGGEKSLQDDNTSFLRDINYFLGDNHHLNDEGHSLLAENVLLPIIQHILKRKFE